MLEFLQPAGDFLFCPLSLLSGALERGPLPVFEFLLPADAFPFLFVPGAFLSGALDFQLGPLPLCAFLGQPLSLLAGAVLQRARQFLPGDPSLLRGLLALGDAATLGRLLLLAPGFALLFLAGAFFGGYALALDLRGAFLFLAGAQLCSAFLLEPDALLFLAGTFFGGCAFPFPLGCAFPLGCPFPFCCAFSLGCAFLLLACTLLLLACTLLLLACALLGGCPLFFLPCAFFRGALFGCLTFTLDLRRVFFFLPGEFFGRGAFKILSRGWLLRYGTLALGGT